MPRYAQNHLKSNIYPDKQQADSLLPPLLHQPISPSSPPSPHFLTPSDYARKIGIASISKCRILPPLSDYCHFSMLKFLDKIYLFWYSMWYIRAILFLCDEFFYGLALSQVLD